MDSKTLQKTFTLILVCSCLVLVLYSPTKNIITTYSNGYTPQNVVRNTLGLDNVTRNSELLHNMSYMTKYIGNNKLPVTANDDSKYLIENPVLCDSGELFFLLIVPSATNHSDRRQFIRETWMNKANLPDHISARTLFLLGTTQQTSVQTQIVTESRQYGDILQGDFVDTYHNLTHKGVMAYRWISKRCQNAKYIVKIDDDTIVNVEHLIRVTLQSIEGKKKTIMCQIVRKSKIIRRQHKWQVENSWFPGLDVYPTYCSGAVVVITNDLPPILYEAAKTTPFFWVEDVYLYGLLPNRVPGFNFVSIKNICGGIECVLLCRNPNIRCNYTVIFDLDLSTLREEWNRTPKS